MEAEYVTALFLKSSGWDVTLSKGSRGPADLTARRDDDLWLVQVKSSRCIPRLKGYEVKRLIDLAYEKGGKPVVATLRPRAWQEQPAFDMGTFALSFYLLDEWKPLDPRNSRFAM